MADSTLYVQPAIVKCQGSGTWLSIVISAPPAIVKLSGSGGKLTTSVYILAPPAIVRCMGSPYITYSSLNPKSSWVGWSKIGDTRILIDLSNEAGYRPMDWPGYVYNILSLGKYAVIYGSDGITQMIPVSAPYATFGFKDISKVGIYHKGCVTGDEDVHYFIDANKFLYRLSEGKGLEFLGFKEFIEAIIPTNPDLNKTLVMSYDPLNKRVYISSVTDGLVLTETGLGGGIASLTSIQRDGRVLLFGSPVDLLIPNFEIVTDILDFEYRGIKTIQSIEVGTDITEGLYVAIDYRFNKASAFATTVYKLCNKEGVGFPIISGVDFRIRVKSLSQTYCELDYLNIKFKVTDKRFMRGPTAIYGGK